MTQDLDIQRIAHALVGEYQAQGYEAQRAGTPEEVIIQLRKDSTLRAITGFNKVLGITLQKVQGGTLVKEGAQEWTDQLVVGAIGLALHPLLVTAAVGAATQYSVVPPGTSKRMPISQGRGVNSRGRIRDQQAQHSLVQFPAEAMRTSG